MTLRLVIATCWLLNAVSADAAGDDRSMRLGWKNNILSVNGPDLPKR